MLVCKGGRTKGERVRWLALRFSRSGLPPSPPLFFPLRNKALARPRVSAFFAHLFCVRVKEKRLPGGWAPGAVGCGTVFAVEAARSESPPLAALPGVVRPARWAHCSPTDCLGVHKKKKKKNEVVVVFLSSEKKESTSSHDRRAQTKPSTLATPFSFPRSAWLLPLSPRALRVCVLPPHATPPLTSKCTPRPLPACAPSTPRRARPGGRRRPAAWRLCRRHSA